MGTLCAQLCSREGGTHRVSLGFGVPAGSAGTGLALPPLAPGVCSELHQPELAAGGLEALAWFGLLLSISNLQSSSFCSK